MSREPLVMNRPIDRGTSLSIGRHRPQGSFEIPGLRFDQIVDRLAPERAEEARYGFTGIFNGAAFALVPQETCVRIFGSTELDVIGLIDALRRLQPREITQEPPR